MSNKRETRRNFVLICTKRDKFRCVCCRGTKEITVHHITDRKQMPGGGYVKENGATLCGDCHLKAEKFHMTEGKEWVEGYHPNDIYAKINSTYEQAYKASQRLQNHN